MSGNSILKVSSNNQRLSDYLKTQLSALDSKYGGSDWFKAFYFKEKGYNKLNGFSATNADYVVVFDGANDQTAAHEFLHSLGLMHTFTNKEAGANAKFTYKYAKTDNLLDYSHHISGADNKRCSLYYWQWEIANSSI